MSGSLRRLGGMDDGADGACRLPQGIGTDVPVVEISRSVQDQIERTIGSLPPESGGMLGGDRTTESAWV